MKRALILIVVACGSKSGDAPTPPPTPAPHPAPTPAPADAGPRWPTGFPAKGAPPVAGKLVDKPFKVAKAMVRESAGVDELVLYSWKSGGDCEPQFAPDPDQLYISIQFPRGAATAGSRIRGGDPSTSATYKHEIDIEHHVHDDFALELDEVTPKHVTARLWFTAEDGSIATGSIDATMCASVQHDVAEPEPILGMKWGDTAASVATLPSKPITATYLGKRASPVVVEVVDWQDGTFGQHELHIFMTPPKVPCAMDALGTGFKVGFPNAIVVGQGFSTAVTTVTQTGNPWADVEWQDTGNVVGMEGRGRATVTIDTVRGDEVRGRVFAWFEDPAKSMVAGAFVAKRCHTKP